MEKDDNEFIYNYVKLYIKGEEKDTLSNPEIKSRVHQNNLFHSIYEEKAEKPEVIWKLYNPSLAFLVIEVMNAKTQTVIKSNAIKVCYLRQGLRSIPLLENNLYDDHISALLVDLKISNVKAE